MVINSFTSDLYFQVIKCRPSLSYTDGHICVKGTGLILWEKYQDELTRPTPNEIIQLKKHA